MAFKITFKIWILIIFISLSLISIFSIPPEFLKSGVLVTSVEKNSTIFENGLAKNMIIKSINQNEIKTIQDFSQVLNDIFSDNQEHKLEIITNQKEITNLFNSDIINHISVGNIPKTRLTTGLDIQGGSRALVTSSEVELTDSQLDDLISVSQERLNVYGLADVKLKKISDLSGNKFMLVELAGSSPGDLEELIAKQGKFEAKIGNETVFVGGKEDITYVGRTGQDAGIYECFQVEEGEACNFRFVIFLSNEAAQRHADITSNLSLDVVSGGQYLEKQIDFYVDDILTESLNIGVDLKGRKATQIQISGSGSGPDRQTAIEDSQNEMKKLQTILITGSLPFKLEIVQSKQVSPILGNEFTKSLIIAGTLAILAVSLLVFIRYKKIKSSLTILIVSFSEVFIILGVAALIGWNLDLPSIAGIIATIGTGIDSQIIILDEAKNKTESIKQRIKKALFIILTAYFTTFVALVPLTGALSFMGIGAASAGLLKGFAITTLIGITAGVFITRPAFADMISQFEED